LFSISRPILPIRQMSVLIILFKSHLSAIRIVDGCPIDNCNVHLLFAHMCHRPLSYSKKYIIYALCDYEVDHKMSHYRKYIHTVCRYIHTYIVSISTYTLVYLIENSIKYSLYVHMYVRSWKLRRRNI
jgi:hypothetical protein